MQSGYNAPEAVGFSRRTASSSLKYASIPASSSLPDRKIRPLRVEDFARGGRSCPARRAGAGILPYGKNAQQSGCGRHSAQNALYPDCIDYHYYIQFCKQCQHKFKNKQEMFYIVLLFATIQNIPKEKVRNPEGRRNPLRTRKS